MQDQPLIKIRVCKNCNLVKNLDEFPKNRNKNENNITYRHMCAIYMCAILFINKRIKK